MTAATKSIAIPRCGGPTRCAREHGDFVSASLLEDWIDETESRYWFLFEMHRDD
jgi:DNA-binding ferritin-like protein